MNTRLLTYLPQDRLRALSRGEMLPDRMFGAALIADLSGFTSLTENLRDTLGRRFGAEVLTRNLNSIFTMLVAEVEHYGGSVIGFAGDAITCWFDQNDDVEFLDGENKLLQRYHSSLRALACGLAMQTVMRSLSTITLPVSTPTLTLKIGIASGMARRFIVGDPEIQALDVLGGGTLDRMAAGEQLAAGGETLLDAETAGVLEKLFIRPAALGWRVQPITQEKFAVLNPAAAQQAAGMLSSAMKTLSIQKAVARTGWAVAKSAAPIAVRSWLPSTVFEKELAGHGDFLAEFRPCVAMFVRFTGINYDSPAAAPQLDQFLRSLQSIMLEYGGVLLSVSVGDKGSYAFIAFGALVTHEDDLHRAVKTAIQIRDMAGKLKFLKPVQIGLSRGVQYVGVYGGTTRRTFSVLGDDVNLAARLMEIAAPGEILLSGRAQYAVSNLAVIKPHLPATVKGKSSQIPVVAVTGLQTRRAVRLQEQTFSLPFVGRQAELEQIEARLDEARRGHGQVLGIVADAGVGKSRLLAEMIRMARRKGFIGYSGGCQSDGVDSPYLMWKPVWNSFFDVDASFTPAKVNLTLTEKLRSLAPHRAEVLPLLGQVLDHPEAFTYNAFTQSLDPKSRKNILHNLLQDCLKAAAQTEPVLIVVEDAHWMDALSHDLLEDIAQSVVNARVMIALAYRPPYLEWLRAARVESLPHYTRISLSELSRSECSRIASAKLAEVYPQGEGVIPHGLLDTLMERTQGNPFYLEELINYLHDHELNPYDPFVLEQLTVSQEIELPDSLHTLILGRIDHLPERQKMALRVASIAGRTFRSAWLSGCYPALDDSAQLRKSLDELETEGLITRLPLPAHAPETEQAYDFKNAITRTVVYESMSYSRRAQLHEQMARYLELNYYPTPSILNLLTHHYSQSDNLPKKMDYLRKAGDAAQASFANDAALGYFFRLLPLLTEPQDRIDLHLKWGVVLELVGQWEQAESHYNDALALAEDGNQPASLASCQLALGKFMRLSAHYTSAVFWLQNARDNLEVAKNRAGMVQVLIELATVYLQIGDYISARCYINDGLMYARELNDQQGIAQSLQVLGTISWNEGKYAEARPLYAKTLELRREMGDKQGIADALHNLGLMAYVQDDFLVARSLYEESMALRSEIGDQAGIARSLNNIGMLACEQGDYSAAQGLHEEGLKLRRALGDKAGMIMSLNNLGEVALCRGEYARAIDYFSEAAARAEELGHKVNQGHARLGLGLVALARNDIVEAQQTMLESLKLYRETGQKPGTICNLIGLARVFLTLGDPWRAAQLIGSVQNAIGPHYHIKAIVRPLYDQVITSVCQEIGEPMFDEARREGKELTLEQIIDLTLDEFLPH